MSLGGKHWRTEPRSSFRLFRGKPRQHGPSFKFNFLLHLASSHKVRCDQISRQSRIVVAVPRWILIRYQYAKQFKFTQIFQKNTKFTRFKGKTYPSPFLVLLDLLLISDLNSYALKHLLHIFGRLGRTLHVFSFMLLGKRLGGEKT
jgi:hypothetical protein